MALNSTIPSDSYQQLSATPILVPGSILALELEDESILANHDSIRGSEELGEEDLSESELRLLYENEEIDRFLHLFSTYVTEVRVPDPMLNDTQTVPPVALVDETEWTDENNSEKSSQQPGARTLSEEIVIRLVIPYLPPSKHTAPPFTIGRLRLATQRLYLSAEATYLPFIVTLVELSTWKNFQRSLAYCIVCHLLFWMLWWYNVLLPAFIFRILLDLLRRRLLPYPTLAELRDHRHKVSRADEFGNELFIRLSASPTLDIEEMWSLLMLAKQLRKTKEKAPVKDSLISATQEQILAVDAEDRDLKRVGLHAISEIADLHERIRNIFIWRRASSSKAYATALFLLFLAVLIIPSKFLAKGTYFTLGFFFWHVVPLLAAMPSNDKARLPPAFSDVPTDAEYAMELISRRVASGQGIKPTKHKRRRVPNALNDKIARNDGHLSYSETQLNEYDTTSTHKKWGQFGKLLANEGSRILAENSSTTGGEGTSFVSRILALGQPEANVDVHTYPGQCSSGPGLITLTANSLFFSPLKSQNPKLIIELPSIKGVKKVGVLKGLQICWTYTNSEGVLEVREEKFSWVSGRDDLFARLVSIDAKRWQKV